MKRKPLVLFWDVPTCWRQRLREMTAADVSLDSCRSALSSSLAPAFRHCLRFVLLLLTRASVPPLLQFQVGGGGCKQVGSVTKRSLVVFTDGQISYMNCYRQALRFWGDHYVQHPSLLLCCCTLSPLQNIPLTHILPLVMRCPLCTQAGSSH